MDRRHTDAPADHDHGAEPAHFRRLAQRPQDVLDLVSLGEILAQMPGGVPHRLDHQGDGAFFPVEITNGQRDPFAGFVHQYHDELSRFAFVRNQRRIHFKFPDCRCQLQFFQDLCHTKHSFIVVHRSS